MKLHINIIIFSLLFFSVHNYTISEKSKTYIAAAGLVLVGGFLGGILTKACGSNDKKKTMPSTIKVDLKKLNDFNKPYDELKLTCLNAKIDKNFIYNVTILEKVLFKNLLKSHEGEFNNRFFSCSDILDKEMAIEGDALFMRRLKDDSKYTVNYDLIKVFKNYFSYVCMRENMIYNFGGLDTVLQDLMPIKSFKKYREGTFDNVGNYITIIKNKDRDDHTIFSKILIKKIFGENEGIFVMQSANEKGQINKNDKYVVKKQDNECFEQAKELFENNTVVLKAEYVGTEDVNKVSTNFNPQPVIIIKTNKYLTVINSAHKDFKVLNFKISNGCADMIQYRDEENQQHTIDLPSALGLIKTNSTSDLKYQGNLGICGSKIPSSLIPGWNDLVSEFDNKISISVYGSADNSNSKK